MTITKQERLDNIIEMHVFQRADKAYEVLSQEFGECYSDCWANMFYDDEELIEDIHGFEDMTADEQEQAIEDIRDNGEDYQEIYEYWLVSDWLYRKQKSSR